MKGFYGLFFIFSLLISLSCDGHADTKHPKSHSSITADNISNQQITDFEEDEFGYIWIGTNRGVNKYNGYNFQQFFHTKDSMSLSNNQIETIFSDSKGRLWVGAKHGVSLFNKQGLFMQIPVESNNQNILQIREGKDNSVLVNTAWDICKYDTLQNRFISCISLIEKKALIADFHVDEEGKIWCITQSCIYCHDGKSFTLTHSFPTPKPIHYSFLRKNGELWLASGKDLYILDTKNNKFIPVPTSLHNHTILSNSVLKMIYPYDDVSLLLNTQANGIFLFNTYSGKIIHQSDSEFPFTVPNTDITVIYRDKRKNLWIGSYDQGFSVQYEYIHRFNNNDYLRTQLEGKSVVSTAVDKQQNLWIVTRAQGLKLWNQSDQKIWDINTDSFLSDGISYKNRIISLFIDSNDNIWLWTLDKIIRCRYRNRQLIREKQYPIDVKINCMTEDFSGNIWMAGENEYLYYLNEFDEFEKMQLYPQSLNFTNGLITLSNGKLLIASFGRNLHIIDPISRAIEEIDILSQINTIVFVPSVIFEDSRGIIWIGTYGNGLFRLSFLDKKIELVQGLACDEVTSITEDSQGNIWIGTLYGLSKYDFKTSQLNTYYKSDGTGGNQFNERSNCRINNGSVIFGGTHGLTIFDPIDVTSRSKIPLFIEELKIHNQKVIPEKGGIIETDMIMNPKVMLAHNHNSIQIAYAALDYSEFKRVKYAYKLEGFDPYWIEANTLRQAFYSNLPAGDYLFKVKTISNDNSVEEATASLPIHIKRAPWLSIPMLILYLLIAGITLMYIYNLIIRLRENRKKAQQAIFEKEQEQKINRMNMSFFANISHEFRTPLTMIAGPVNQLLNNPDIKNENKNLLIIVQRSVDRMLRLVNQLMDFNKLESDMLKLKIGLVEITGIIKDYIDIFRVNAEEKQISIITTGLQSPFQMWLDADVFHKVLSNLMSNALKFSKPGGVIDIRFDVISRSEAAKQYPLNNSDTVKEYAQVSVGDIGIGIPEDKLEEVFKRYYQVSNDEVGHVNWGTGIGLYFSRRLVEMHHGYIKAANKPEGGSQFSFILPVDIESYTIPEMDLEVTQVADPIKTEPLTPLQLYETELVTNNENTRYTLLVVDDDTEITYYLKTLLSPIYNIVTAFDADIAWNMIENVEPDLIISDVMMPGTDGLNFCIRLKENIETCHIPVVLLTAKVTINDQIEGLNMGANAYITKPFNPSYLLALIKSQLKNRDYTREILSESTKPHMLSEEIINAQDKDFMENLYKLMEVELSNPELNISRMTEVFHISRTKFYYKVKGLTGITPSLFFKNYKLNRAAELIHERTYTMSEIADLTGFSTASHFSASFKKKFGVSPSEY